jgi:hypothetical protein
MEPWPELDCAQVLPLPDQRGSAPRADPQPGQFRCHAKGLLALIGGVVGVFAGAVATVVYATSKGWDVVIPVESWLGGITSAILIGAVAGLMPAVRASRMSPTAALRTV